MIKKKYCESTSLKCEGLVFDLDGTLLNTLKGHAQSFNRALETLKMPRHPIDSYRYFIGNGAQMCARRSLPSDSHHLIEECVNLFKDDYACSWYETTVPYLGIQELLKECSELNIKFSVLRYGNVMFSRGSILPLLIERYKQKKSFRITDTRMTRFVLTLDEGVELVLWTLLNSIGSEIPSAAIHKDWDAFVMGNCSALNLN